MYNVVIHYMFLNLWREIYLDRKHTIKGFIYVILSAVIYGTMPLMAKHIYSEGVNPLSLVFLRNLLAFPFLAILAKVSGNSLAVKLKDIPTIGIVGLMGCCITPLLLFSSYNYMDTGTATIFHFIYPGVVVLMGFLFLKKKVGAGTIVSLLLCLGGIALFYTPGSQISLAGSVYAFTSGVTYAVYVVLLANFKRKELSGWVLSFYISLICSVVLFVVCVASGQLTFPVSLQGWGLSLVFALMVNVGALVLFQNGARIIGGEKAAILSTFEPITSVVAGALFLGEVIGISTGIGTVMVLAASIMITVFDKNKENGK